MTGDIAIRLSALGYLYGVVQKRRNNSPRRRYKGTLALHAPVGVHVKTYMH